MRGTLEDDVEDSSSASRGSASEDPELIGDVSSAEVDASADLRDLAAEEAQDWATVTDMEDDDHDRPSGAQSSGHFRGKDGEAPGRSGPGAESWREGASAKGDGGDNAKNDGSGGNASNNSVLPSVAPGHDEVAVKSAYPPLARSSAEVSGAAAHKGVSSSSSSPGAIVPPPKGAVSFLEDVDHAAEPENRVESFSEEHMSHFHRTETPSKGADADHHSAAAAPSKTHHTDEQATAAAPPATAPQPVHQSAAMSIRPPPPKASPFGGVTYPKPPGWGKLPPGSVGVGGWEVPPKAPPMPTIGESQADEKVANDLLESIDSGAPVQALDLPEGKPPGQPFLDVPGQRTFSVTVSKLEAPASQETSLVKYK